jgi:hypothetical protein
MDAHDNESRSPSARAMSFFHARNLLTALTRAERFGDRIATLPEVALARTSADADAFSWTNDFVTGSAEYFGQTRTGIQVIAILHGAGPLADATGAFDAYGVGEAGAHAGGSVSQTEFLGILDGAYGPVEIVELRRLLALRSLPFTETLTHAQACADPLVRARLGPAADSYLKRQRQVSENFRADRGDYASQNSCTLRLSDPDKHPYLGCPPAAGRASAHLLRLSSHVDYDHGHYGGKEPVRHVSRVSTLGAYVWGEPARVIGVRGEGAFTNVLPGAEALLRDLPKLWQKLLRPSPEVRLFPRLIPLTRVGLHWFTQRAREGVGIDDGEPEFRVRSITRVGETVEFTAPLRGDRNSLRYDRREVELVAPPGANAYRLVGTPRTAWGERGASHLSIPADFYRVDVDTEKSLPAAEEIADDLDLLMALAPER